MSDERGYHDCSFQTLETELETDRDQGLTTAAAQEKLARDGLNELHKKAPPTLAMLFLIQMLNVIMLLLSASACASLIIAASSGKGAEAFVEGIAIFVIVILNAIIGAVSENVANNSLEALKKMSQAECNVIRNGEEVKIDSTQVVAGDIVVLAVGDIVPADVRLLDSNEIKVNEMLLTGEPDDVAKSFKCTLRDEDGINYANEPLASDAQLGKPLPETGGGARKAPGRSFTMGGSGHGEEKLTPPTMCFSSCLVTNGKGKGVVTDTGMRTRVGAIAAMLESDTSDAKTCFCLPDTSANQTPMQKSINDLGLWIGYGAIIVCGIVFLTGLILERRDETDPSRPIAIYMIMVAVTLAVAAIPEGIPLCVTISLSTGCNEMVKRNVLVRRLAAVETLGSASVICTDKTGTLTEGKMTMVKMWSGGKLYDISGAGFDPNVGKVYPTDDPLGIPHQTSKSNLSGLFSSVSQSNIDAEPQQLVAPSVIPGEGKPDSGQQECSVRSTLLSGLLCCNTTISKNEEGRWQPKGNSSEAPIVVAAAKVGFWQETADDLFERVVEIPFNSSRKMMVIVAKIKKDLPDGKLGERGVKLPEGTKYITVVKGAPNIIVDFCESIATKDGKALPFQDRAKKGVMGVIDHLSGQALRVLAIGVGCMPELPFDLKDDSFDSDKRFEVLVKNAEMRFMGLFASIDPPREGVKEAVIAANGASIRCVMITGDYLATAKAIARNIAILKEDDTDENALDCGMLRPDGEYLSNTDMDFMTMKIKVFARAKPEDKLEIVRSFQRQGLVSAMTGDGVNDAPALANSDIGVAMGIQGTDVAKGASDMILTDDNFVSIVGAVEMGRVIYAGIQKFIAFIMSVHIGEVMQIFLSVIVGCPLIRQPLQILFLILVTDLPPAVALGREPGERTIMQNRPRPKSQPIVLRWMWQSIWMNGLILTVIVFVIYLFALDYYVGSLDGEEIMAAIKMEDESWRFCPSLYCQCRRGQTAQFNALTEMSKAAANSDDDCLYGNAKAPFNTEIPSVFQNLRKARTSAFMAVVFSENIRAYTSRTFETPFYVDFFTNKSMQIAIFLAEFWMWFIVLCPYVSTEIFGLEALALDGRGFLYAFIAPVLCVIFCEAYKFLVKRQIAKWKENLLKEQLAEEADRVRRITSKEPLEEIPRNISGHLAAAVKGSKKSSQEDAADLKEVNVEMAETDSKPKMQAGELDINLQSPANGNGEAKIEGQRARDLTTGEVVVAGE